MKCPSSPRAVFAEHVACRNSSAKLHTSAHKPIDFSMDMLHVWTISYADFDDYLCTELMLYRIFSIYYPIIKCFSVTTLYLLLLISILCISLNGLIFLVFCFLYCESRKKYLLTRKNRQAQKRTPTQRQFQCLEIHILKSKVKQISN